MSFSAAEFLTGFAQAASLVQAVGRPEDAGPTSEPRSDVSVEALESVGAGQSERRFLPLPRLFLPPVVPLFAPAIGSDVVLIRGEGIHFDVVLVLDRTRDPATPFTADAKTIQEAAASCIALTGRVQGHPLPVKVLVLELHQGERDPKDHLARLGASAGEHKVAVRAAAVNVKTGAVWSSTRWPFPDELAGLLRETCQRLKAGAVDEEIPPAPPPSRHRPFATYTLLGVMLGMFGAELVVDGPVAWFSPKGTTLLALGGLSLPALVRDHAVYRLLSCGFLHAGIVHLGFNGLALFLVGSFVERLAGPAWVLTTFVVSLLGGSFASMAVNREHAFTVGASGAIMGLIAGGLALTRRMPYGPHRTMARTRLWQWLVPALIPITFHTGLGTIDVGAHLGGAAAGAALGAWLLHRWDARRPWPHRPPPRVQARLRVFAWVGSLAAVLSLGWAVARSPGWLADAAIEERLMPEDVANKLADRVNALLRGPAGEGDVAADTELGALRDRYPGDPRALYVSALWEFQKGQDARGEGFLRQGLSDSRMLTRAFGNRALEIDMRRHLALADLRRGDEAQARKDLAPVCGLKEPALNETWALELCQAGGAPGTTLNKTPGP